MFAYSKYGHVDLPDANCSFTGRGGGSMQFINVLNFEAFFMVVLSDVRPLYTKTFQMNECVKLEKKCLKSG